MIHIRAWCGVAARFDRAHTCCNGLSAEMLTGLVLAKLAIMARETVVARRGLTVGERFEGKRLE
jgi:hypothetical protein